jgi:hypothetical protein
MSNSMNTSKFKEPPTLLAQSVCKELDRDQFSELDSSEASANDIELEIDMEVVEQEPVVTKKKTMMKDVKGKGKGKGKDKVPIINLQDKIRANRQKILDLGGRLKVGGQIA